MQKIFTYRDIFNIKDSFKIRLIYIAFYKQYGLMQRVFEYFKKNQEKN